MIHNPLHDNSNNEQERGPNSTDRAVLLRLARYQPHSLESAQSPTQVEYLRGIDGIEPGSRLHIRARAPGNQARAITYEMDLGELPPTVRDDINQILKAAESSGKDPHHVALQIYETTAQLGSTVWRVLEPTLVPSIESALERRMFKPLVPPLHAYLRDPHSIGRRFSATRRLARQQVTVSTRLDAVTNTVRIHLTQDASSPARAEHYIVPSKIQARSSVSPEEVKSDLRSIAFSALGCFSENGLIAFRKHMTKTAEDLFMSNPAAEPQTVTYTKRFPWNSTLRVKVRPSRAVVTISSGGVDKAARLSGTATMYKWYISPKDLVQGGASVQETLSQVLQLFGTLEGGKPLTTIVRDLKLLTRRQGVFARASVESILGSDVTETVRSVRGIRVERLAEDKLIRSDQIADTLRGINVVHISPILAPAAEGKPQVIRNIEVGVSKQAGENPELHLVAWNQINNRIHVKLSASSIQRYGGLEKTLVDVSCALRDQASATFPWQGRAAFLHLLNVIAGLDPASSCLVQMGEAKLPNASDIVSNRMIDQVAAPLIVLFGELCDNDGITESYVRSLAEKQLQIVLGECYQPYALLLDIHEKALRKISVVPRTVVQNGEHVLAFNKSRQFTVYVPHVHKDGLQTLRQLVMYFADMVTSTPPTRFKSSGLHAYLHQLSRQTPPED